MPRKRRLDPYFTSKSLLVNPLNVYIMAEMAYVPMVNGKQLCLQNIENCIIARYHTRITDEYANFNVVV